MPEFVEINGVFNLLDAATRMVSGGETIRGELTDLMGVVRDAEGDPGTFPPDKFTESFLAKYHGEGDGGEGGLPANEAVRQFVSGGGEDAPGLAGMLSEFGSIASTAMWSYSATDDTGAGNIDDVEA